MMHMQFLGDCLAHCEYSLNVVYCHCLPDSELGARNVVVKHWRAKLLIQNRGHHGPNQSPVGFLTKVLLECSHIQFYALCMAAFCYYGRLKQLSQRPYGLESRKSLLSDPLQEECAYLQSRFQHPEDKMLFIYSVTVPLLLPKMENFYPKADTSLVSDLGFQKIYIFYHIRQNGKIFI